ncbi:MAG: hypothetical protein L6Q92_09320 [Phycisphaerae bacterium]|nr:hypothetical protein [Phycisphaerae bacterium]
MFHHRLRVVALVLAAAIGVLVTTDAYAQQHEGHRHSEPPKKEPAPKSQLPKCPVMGDPVDFSVKTMTTKGPIYFCCADCIKKFETDPTKYDKQVAEQRKMLANLPKVQVTCPVSGKAVDKKAFVEKDGQKVYFCCKDCIAKYEKEPGRYVAPLAGSYTYQARCPVTGAPIDPTAFIKLKGGQTVYFCCDKCDEKFLKDPGKYAPKLELQGIYIDPKKVEVLSGPGNKDTHDEEEHEHEQHGGHDHHDHDH